jgi:hypothetical protein
MTVTCQSETFADRSNDEYLRDVQDSTELGTDDYVKDDGTVTTEHGVFRNGRPVRNRSLIMGNDDIGNGIKVLSHKGGVTYIGKGRNRVQVWSAHYAYRARCSCGQKFEGAAPARPVGLEGPETVARALAAAERVTLAVYVHLNSEH